MSGRSANAEKSFWASFRRVLRDLDTVSEKARRAEIRAGKKKQEHDSDDLKGKDTAVRVTNPRRKADVPKGAEAGSGSTRKGGYKSSREGSSRSRGAGSKGVKPIEVVPVPKKKVSPSAMKRKAIRAEKFGTSAEQAKIPKASGDHPAKGRMRADEKERRKHSGDPRFGRASLRPKAHTIGCLIPVPYTRMSEDLFDALALPGSLLSEEWETSKAIRSRKSYSFKSYVGGNEIRFVHRDYLRAARGATSETNKSLNRIRVVPGFKASKKPTPGKGKDPKQTGTEELKPPRHVLRKLRRSGKPLPLSRGTGQREAMPSEKTGGVPAHRGGRKNLPSHLKDGEVKVHVAYGTNSAGLRTVVPASQYDFILAQSDPRRAGRVREGVLTAIQVAKFLEDGTDPTT